MKIVFKHDLDEDDGNGTKAKVVDSAKDLEGTKDRGNGATMMIWPMNLRTRMVRLRIRMMRTCKIMKVFLLKKIWLVIHVRIMGWLLGIKSPLWEE